MKQFDKFGDFYPKSNIISYSAMNMFCVTDRWCSAQMLLSEWNVLYFDWNFIERYLSTWPIENKPALLTQFSGELHGQ